MQRTFSRLESLIIALLRMAGDAGLSKTQLIKLVFFSDLESARMSGETVTGCEYRTDQFGVVNYEIWDVALVMADGECISYSVKPAPSGGKSYRIALLRDEFDPTAPELLAVVRRVWEKYGRLTAAQLGGLSKNLVPMDDEWETGVVVDPRDICYEESDEFLEHCKSVLKDYPKEHSPLRPLSDLEDE